MGKFTLKRAFDVTFATAGLIVTAPLIALTAGVMAVANKSWPFFLQKRIGLDRDVFTILKIKTMNDKRDAMGGLLPDDARTSKAGIFVRKTRLDELPQLLNIIKGDMSFVGPRPLPLSCAIAHDPLRAKVRPGLTGLSQIKGATILNAAQTKHYDLLYVREHFSKSAQKQLATDISIILKTPFALIRNRKDPHSRTTGNDL